MGMIASYCETISVALIDNIFGSVTDMILATTGK